MPLHLGLGHRPMMFRQGRDGPYSGIVGTVSHFLCDSKRRRRMEDSVVNVRVLIVDDNKLVRNIAKDMLIYRCGVVDVVSSGAEAIKAVQEYPYDIIFMDYCMPVMDGIQTTRCIRNLEAQGLASDKPHLPIVAFTARVTEEVRAQCLAAGMDDFLAKPVGINQLEEKIIQWALSRHTRTRGGGLFLH